jgi:putative spermidine/putrescine transport system substrate-binding protein
MTDRPTYEETRHEEALEHFRDRTEGRVIDRRGFLAICTALGIPAGAARLTPAAAQGTPREMVLVNWGGDAVRGMRAAWVEPFTRATGRRMAIDGTGPSTGRIRLMVQSGRVTWDVMDRNLHTALEIGPEGVLEEIDYTIVDRGKVRPEHANRWGIGNYTYAHVLTYNARRWGGRVPTTWKDVWDTRGFPGRRAFRRTIDGALEAALLADGVPKERVYPIDMKRALDGHKAIKANTIYYNAIAEGQAAFRDNEVHLGLLLNTRSWPLKQDTNGVCDYTFNEGIVWVAAWMVPKNPPSGRLVWEFIRSTQEAEGQIYLLRNNGYGPVNPAASAAAPPELQAIDPGHPTNYAKMLPGGVEWYAEHATNALQQYLDAISS